MSLNSNMAWGEVAEVAVHEASHHMGWTDFQSRSGTEGAYSAEEVCTIDWWP